MKPLCCYLCNGTKFERIAKRTRDFPNVYVIRCEQCGLVSLSSFLHICDDFYKRGMMHDWNKEKWESWVRSTRKDDARRVIYLRDKMKNMRLLDFGCGNCEFILKARLTTHGEIIGVEPDNAYKKYAEEALKRAEISVYKSLYDILDKKFDMITMFHVIEHLIDPIPILEQLIDLLADDGILVIETPNANDALLSLYKCQAFSAFTYWGCHVRLYDQNTLQALLKKVGLKGDVQQIQRYPLSNHLYWMSNGKPGGHEVWDFMNSPELTSSYESALLEKMACDTIMGIFYK